MRINKFIAQSTILSRRAADVAISENRVRVNGQPAFSGQQVSETDSVTFDGVPLESTIIKTTIMLNKPVGYVVSRDGQGSSTVYDLLPAEFHHLQPVGRLDKASSGLLLMTNDGDLANRLTHPSHQKNKIYEITLDKPLAPLHHQMISDHGISLEDGPSKLQLVRLHEGDDVQWEVTMYEGRNRQIRRTFQALGYSVQRLHRWQFGDYQLGDLKPGKFKSSSLV